MVGIGINLIYGQTWRNYGIEVGVQIGAVNLQIGAVHIAGKVDGVQIGVLNIARRLRGIQPGGIHIAYESPIPFLVGLNVGW